MLPWLKYTVMRLTLFVAAMGVLWLLGLRTLLNVVVAAVVSLMVSYVLLRKQREELSEHLAARMGDRGEVQRAKPKRRTKADDDAAFEDAALDASAADVTAGDVTANGASTPAKVTPAKVTPAKVTPAKVTPAKVTADQPAAE